MTLDQIKAHWRNYTVKHSPKNRNIVWITSKNNPHVILTTYTYKNGEGWTERPIGSKD